MRAIGSAETDMYSSLAGAAAALYGPLHGGANEAVLRMLASIGSRDNVGGYIERVKKHEVLLYGFGHRVYKNYDPRATVIKGVVDEVLGSRARIRCSPSRRSSSGSRSRTTTSSRASYIRTSTSTRGSPIARSASTRRRSPSCSASHAPSAGSATTTS